MDYKNVWGWIIFIFGSVLYTSNQSYQYLLFANSASEIIFSFICYALICGGIALTVFEYDQCWTEIFWGVLSIFFTFTLFNTILLIYDSVTHFYYDSTQYFVLLEYANNLGTIADPLASIFTTISFPLGLLFWTLISGKEMHFWYEVLLYATICLVLSMLFPWLNGIQIFGVW